MHNKGYNNTTLTPNDLKNDLKHRYKRKSSAGGSVSVVFPAGSASLKIRINWKKIGFSLYIQGKYGYLGVY